MEAVAKHTAEGGQGAEVRVAPQSVVSRGNQTSLQTGKGKLESLQTARTKQQHSFEPPMSLVSAYASSYQLYFTFHQQNKKAKISLPLGSLYTYAHVVEVH